MRNVEEQWLHLALLGLLVDVLHEVALALDPPERDLADLLRVEAVPRLVVHVLKEGHDVDRINEVDEGVPDVAPVVQVERQVEEVVAALVVPVDALQEHLLRVLVRNVPDHDSGASVLPAQDPLQVHGELGIGALGGGLFVGDAARGGFASLRGVLI